MALIDCPECGKRISDQSTACPHCGLPSEHYPVNDMSKLRSSSHGLVDCAVIKSLLTQYPNLLLPIAEIHNHLVSLGMLLEEDVDRVRYNVDGRQQLQVYPSRNRGASFTIKFIDRDNASTILVTRSSHLERTKQFISRIAKEKGLL